MQVTSLLSRHGTSTTPRVPRAATIRPRTRRQSACGRPSLASFASSTRSSWIGASTRAKPWPAPAHSSAPSSSATPSSGPPSKTSTAASSASTNSSPLPSWPPLPRADYKTAGVVAFFMVMGEIIETRTAEGARASIESLIRLTPTKARRITKAGEEEVAAQDLAIGDVIRVRPGDNVAADGVIVGRPRLFQPSHHHRRIAAGGQETWRRGLRGHPEPHRRSRNQSHSRRHRHHPGARPRIDPGRRKNPAPRS